MNNEIDDQIHDVSIMMKDFANGAAKEASEIISQSFRIAGSEISNALERASKSGEISMKRLVASIVREISELALQKLVVGPIEGAFSQPNAGISSILRNFGDILGSQNIAPPNAANSISAPVNININLPQGANLSDARKSASQISASLARVVNRGRGLL